MNCLDIYRYLPAICMNWLDIEILACNMNEFHIYIYIYIFTRDLHEMPRYRDIRLQ